MYRFLRPLVFLQDPENAHDRILKVGEYLGRSPLRETIGWVYDYEDSRLETDALGIDFRNPVGLAAGFDKNGVLLDILPYLGFGYAEIGSVTARASDGNPRPRLFRLPKDEAVINRMGLNNEGADAVAKRLTGKKSRIPVGINIAKTNDPSVTGDAAIEDYCYSFERLYGIADYIVINVSCPNTEDGRTFEEPASLRELMNELERVERGLIRNGYQEKPILIKLSPDLKYREVDEVLEASGNYADGYVISNTTSGRGGLKTSREKLEKIGRGGLSGPPLRKLSTGIVSHVSRQLATEYPDNSRRPTIIGVGGIDSPGAAYEKIQAGASLVQLLTGPIPNGPGLIKRINQGLVEFLERDGFSSIQEAVGSAL